jgi:hypothetical protein
VRTKDRAETVPDPPNENDLLEIDKDALDIEWQRQPTLFRSHARRLANLRKTLRDQQRALKLLTAELRLEIRRDPERYDMPVGRVVESVVDAIIETNPKYRRAIAVVEETEHKVDLADGVVRSLWHRKDALEHLVQLWSQSYFAECRQPRGTPTTLDSIHRGQRGRRHSDE